MIFERLNALETANRIHAFSAAGAGYSTPDVTRIRLFGRFSEADKEALTAEIRPHFEGEIFFTQYPEDVGAPDA